MSAISLLNQNYYTIKSLRELMNKNKLIINKKYQRSFVWTKIDRLELIRSILKNYPIGVVVLWKNKENKLEVLDGHQRLKTIEEYLDGKPLYDSDRPFRKLDGNTRSEFYGYRVPYLRLANDLTDQQVSDIFIRLQEATPLSIGEKLYAFRGKFRDAFVDAFYSKDNKPFFENMKDWRFKARFLAAALLVLELKSNFRNEKFPDIRYRDFKRINNQYRTKPVPHSIIKRYNENLQFLGKYLYGMLGRLKPQDIIAPYLLVSYFTQHTINNKYQGIIFKDFMFDFQNDLQKFSILKPKKPRDLSKSVFDRLYLYKINKRRGIISDSFAKRFRIIKGEYERRIEQIKLKYPKRFATQEQKIKLYFKQKGICPICRKEILYKDVEADHIEKYETGGKTEIDNLRLVHHKCHQKIHKNN